MGIVLRVLVNLTIAESFPVASGAPRDRGVEDAAAEDHTGAAIESPLGAAIATLDFHNAPSWSLATKPIAGGENDSFGGENDSIGGIGDRGRWNFDRLHADGIHPHPSFTSQRNA